MNKNKILDITPLRKFSNITDGVMMFFVWFENIFIGITAECSAHKIVRTLGIRSIPLRKRFIAEKNKPFLVMHGENKPSLYHVLRTHIKKVYIESTLRASVFAYINKPSNSLEDFIVATQQCHPAECIYGLKHVAVPVYIQFIFIKIFFPTVYNRTYHPY